LFEKEKAEGIAKSEMEKAERIARSEMEKAELVARSEKEKAELDKDKAETLSKLTSEKELAIIEKQKLEFQEKGKKDEVELEIQLMKAEAESRGITAGTGRLKDGDEGSKGESPTTGKRKQNFGNEPRGLKIKLPPFEEQDDVGTYGYIGLSVLQSLRNGQKIVGLFIWRIC
jgi:hypothetical protein